jgi:type I restriction enzyme, S subunit
VVASLHGLNNSSSGEEFRENARFYFNHLPRLTTRPEHIHQLRQTILNLAVRGKLVLQDPNDEPADTLLQRIKSERRRLASSGEIKQQVLLPDIQKGDTAFEAPEGWTWIPLQNLLKGDSQNGCSKKPDDNPNGIPILRISAGTIRVDGIVAEEEHKLIGGIHPATRAKFGLEPGDLLTCRFNGNRDFVGRFSLYQGYSGIDPIYPDKLIRIRLFADLCVPELMRHFANSSVIRAEIEKYCATTVGNWGISATNLKKIPIPLPPLPEQHRIVAKVDELMALCDGLEAGLTSAATAQRQLLEATLHEALSRKRELQEAVV